MPSDSTRRWKILAKGIRRMVAFAEYLARHSIQLKFLFGHYRGLEGRLQLMTPIPSTSSTTLSTVSVSSPPETAS